ncbi:MAG: polysaccharide deacetylase family protein [Paludibacteraceae bacterium]|nr:polysaccharide deacetylase family protein [Paludibacteraceae bacterium]
MKKRLLTAVSLAALGCMSLSAQQKGEIATWENWAKSAITFTFDDGANEVNSHSWAEKQLNQYGFKATFYVVTGWAGNSWGTYKSFAENGHEIGSHTDSHSGNSSELASSKSTIEQRIGQPCLTIAYPNCNEIDNTLSHYIGGRICGGQTNDKSPRNLARFDCQICGTQGINNSSQFTSRCEGANGGWMVFLIHGIQGYEGNGSYSPTSQDAFTGTLKFLNDHKKDYWVCTARDAIMYLKERDNAKFEKKGGDASSDVYTLTVSLDTKLCNWDYPLSVRVPMQDGWANLTVTQDEKELEFEEKDGYVYFKAIPNKGDIVVGSGQPAVPDPEFTVSVSGKEFCKDSTYKVTWTMSGDANDRTYSLNWGTGSSSTEVSISSVKASSEWENNGTPYWVVDNITSDDGNHGGNSRWGSMSGSDEWVEFNLGKTQSIGGVKIDECTEYDVITAFEIQYDENGSWKTAYTGKMVGHDFSATFSPVSTSKMRLFIKSTEGGDGCNINYVEFSGVAGYVIKDGINAAGSIDWKPKAAGTGMLTITTSKGKVLAQSASIKINNCGGEPCTDCDEPIVGGSGTYFDENGDYFGPECESDGSQLRGAFYTGDYTSPFKTYLGKSDEDIQKKLDQMWKHYFEGSNSVYTDRGNGEAYILDTGNNDVRSEGMSYGMMISVQTNHQEQFKKLWAFAKNHMWHNPSTGGDGYFSWQVGTNGNVQDQGCAPDGEMYFMMSLLFAANRWNDKGYMDDAQAILKACWKGNAQSLFNEDQKVVTFQPSYGNKDFSDPSYDLPAFVDLFSRWSTTNNNTWKQAAKATRDHLYKSSNKSSGLFSDYNNFDGTPKAVDFNQNSQKYMYDAMRCAMNFGMDYYLFGADAERQEEMAKRIIDFFEKDGYQHARFNWDGSNPSESYTLGETGANAVACYALMNNPSYEKQVKTNLNKAWSAGLMTGQYRYYDGLVHYLSMLHLCGSFKIWKPAPSITEKTVEASEYLGVPYSEKTTIESFEDCKLYRVTIDPKVNSLREGYNEKDMILLPNPAKNYFEIKSAKEVESIDVLSMVGQVVYSQNNADRIEVNLPSGTYMVRVKTTDGGYAILKLVVK